MNLWLCASFSSGFRLGFGFGFVMPPAH
jgi:hypothetical protein